MNSTSHAFRQGASLVAYTCTRVQRLEAELAEQRRRAAFWRDYADALEGELAAASARAWDTVAEVPLRSVWESVVDARLAGEPARTAVVFADLDEFKVLNDAHGHLAGDAVLRAVARRFEEAFSARAPVVTRLGGDEFGVVVRDLAEEDLDRFAELMRCPVVLPHGWSVQVSASLGVASGAELPPGAGRDELLRIADAGAYRDKHRRERDQVEVRGAPSPRARERGAVVLGAAR